MGMDVSLIKLNQLVTVARTGSFSKAAVELNISQPALSRAIAAIEDGYGFQIFKRLGHGVELTSAGAQVVEQAKPLMQTMRTFDNNLQLFGTGKAGSLSVGFSPLLASQVLADFAGNFFTPESKVQLNVSIRPGINLIDGLKNDEIELFFFPERYIEEIPELATEVVGVMEPVCVVRAGHPLLALGSVAFEDVANFPWASSVAPPFIGEGIQPAQFTCDNYHILLEAVCQSDLICISSRKFARQALAEGRVAELAIAGLELTLLKVKAAKLAGRVSSPLALAAIEKMRTHLQTI